MMLEMATERRNVRLSQVAFRLLGKLRMCLVQSRTSMPCRSRAATDLRPDSHVVERSARAGVGSPELFDLRQFTTAKRIGGQRRLVDLQSRRRMQLPSGVAPTARQATTIRGVAVTILYSLTVMLGCCVDESKDPATSDRSRHGFQGRLLREGGGAASGVTVAVRRLPDSSEADFWSGPLVVSQDGRFAAPAAPPGSYEVELFAWDVERTRVAPGVFGPYESGGEEVVIIVADAVEYHGRVSDATGSPVVGAAVHVASSLQFYLCSKASTNEDGRFSSWRNPNADAYVRIDARGWRGRSDVRRVEIWRVPAGAPSEQVFLVPEGKSIAGRLVGRRDGAPVKGVALMAIPVEAASWATSQPWNSAISQDDGSFVIGGLSDRRYHVWLAPLWSTEDLEVEIGPGGAGRRFPHCPLDVEQGLFPDQRPCVLLWPPSEQ